MAAATRTDELQAPASRRRFADRLGCSMNATGWPAGPWPVRELRGSEWEAE